MRQFIMFCGGEGYPSLPAILPSGHITRTPDTGIAIKLVLCDGYYSKHSVLPHVLSCKRLHCMIAKLLYMMTSCLMMQHDATLHNIRANNAARFEANLHGYLSL